MGNSSIGVAVIGAGMAGGAHINLTTVSQNDLFVFQTRAFLEQIAGLDRLPPAPTLADGLQNIRLLDAVVASANAGGKNVAVP